MPQNPTHAEALEVIKRYKGLNDFKGSVFRPQGTITAGINLIDSQQWDANRRKGRDFELLDNGNSIYLIIQLDFDDGAVSTVRMGGDTLSYDDFEYPVNGNLGTGATSILNNPLTPGRIPNNPNYAPPLS